MQLSDDQVARALAAALQARTAHVSGSVHSFEDLQQELVRAGVQPVTRRRQHRGRLAVSAVAGVVLLLLVGITLIGHAARSTSRSTAAVNPASLPATGSGYSPRDFYPALMAGGVPVIVRAADDRPVRRLPMARQTLDRYQAMSPMVLSPDGTRVYGVYRDTNVDGSPLAETIAAEHVGYVDLATNRIIGVATRRGHITGMALSQDGSTIAYALRDDPQGQGDSATIYLHDLRHDTDRHLFLPSVTQTVGMALSEDGTQLAYVPSDNPGLVLMMPTTSAPTASSPVRLGVESCPDVRYLAVQWNMRGLYALQECDASGAAAHFRVVTFFLELRQTNAAVVTNVPGGPFRNLVARDFGDGLGLVLDQSQGNSRSLLTYVRNASNPTRVVPGLGLPGPGT